jgi:heat shock protein HtpX
MRFHRDWGLYLRMVGVMLLMGALYVGFAAVIALYFEAAVAVALAVGALSVLQFLWGDKLALKSMGGRVVSEQEYPGVHARVQRLSQQADLPQPEVAVADTEMPNAFAVGRSQEKAVVCVTTGLLETLDGEELDGVLAHELSHVMHRDMMIMTVASGITTMAYFVIRWGWMFDGGDSGNQYLWVAFASSAVVWIASTFVLKLLSRYREYAADRGAASITGNPAALASALMKISDEMETVPNDDLRASAGTNALLFNDAETRLTKWFKTHPAVDERVSRLRTLERDLTR